MDYEKGQELLRRTLHRAKAAVQRLAGEMELLLVEETQQGEPFFAAYPVDSPEDSPFVGYEGYCAPGNLILLALLPEYPTTLAPAEALQRMYEQSQPGSPFEIYSGKDRRALALMTLMVPQQLEAHYPTDEDLEHLLSEMARHAEMVTRMAQDYLDGGQSPPIQS